MWYDGCFLRLSWFAGQLFPLALALINSSFVPLVRSTDALQLWSRLCFVFLHRVTKRPPTPQKRWPSRTPQPSTHLPHRMASPQSLRHRTRFRHRTTPGRAGSPSTPWPCTRPHRRTASRPALTTARPPSPPPRPHRSVSSIICKHCSQHAVSK